MENYNVINFTLLHRNIGSTIYIHVQFYQAA